MKRLFLALLGLWMLSPLYAGDRLLVVFVPAYEGSKLYDPDLAQPGQEAPCVWGDLASIRNKELYYALRLPNVLEPRPMLKAGPLDVYDRLVKTLTRKDHRLPDFVPLVWEKNFRYFSYDWRQDPAKVTTPELAVQIQLWTRELATAKSCRPDQIRLVLIAHSMGGLVVRTLLNDQPHFISRVERLYLLGTPHFGSVKAINTLLIGPGGLGEAEVGFPASILKLLPRNVDALTSRLTAITRPSLQALMPWGDTGWTHRDEKGHDRIVKPDELYQVRTWQVFWPSAETEKSEYLSLYLQRFAGGSSEPRSVRAWQFCQDRSLPKLAHTLSGIQEWRRRLQSLPSLAHGLTRKGEGSRLRVILGTEQETPTGVESEGTGDQVRSKLTFLGENDGDKTVTSVSARGGIHDPKLLLELPGATHGELVKDRRFLDQLRKDLGQLQSTR